MLLLIGKWAGWQTTSCHFAISFIDGKQTKAKLICWQIWSNNYHRELKEKEYNIFAKRTNEMKTKSLHCRLSCWLLLMVLGNRDSGHENRTKKRVCLWGSSSPWIIQSMNQHSMRHNALQGNNASFPPSLAAIGAVLRVVVVVVWFSRVPAPPS